MSAKHLTSLVQEWTSENVWVDHAEVESSVGDVGIGESNEHGT